MIDFQVLQTARLNLIEIGQGLLRDLFRLFGNVWQIEYDNLLPFRKEKNMPGNYWTGSAIVLKKVQVSVGELIVLKQK